MQPNSNVVIVGGGVIGLSIAYFLASKYKVSCLLIERDSIGAHASGTAAGELSPIVRNTLNPELIRFGLEGLAMHREFAPSLIEQTGIDYQLSDTPTMLPAMNQNEMTLLKNKMDYHAQFGVSADWIEQDELRSKGAWLPDSTLGAFLLTEGQLETYQFILALKRAAELQGVKFRHGEVTGILTAHNAIKGVQLGNKSIEADFVILANGPWSQLSGSWIDYPIPVTPLKGQILYLSPPFPTPPHSIFHGGSYVMYKPSGNLIIGTTEEDVGFDANPTPEGQENIVHAARIFAPWIAGIPIKKATACLRPISTDGLPIIGAVPGHSGLYIATGHGHKGILLSLNTGIHMAKLIMEEHNESLDEFSPSRFMSYKLEKD